jgi:hypothetical protein
VEVCATAGEQMMVRRGMIKAGSENPIRRIILPSILVERRFGLRAFTQGE